MRNILILFFVVFALGCSEEKIDAPDLTYENFRANLRQEMSYPQLIQLFGKPAGDVGSGIHIYVYKLTDLTEIRIGHTDHIIYARHVDANGQLLNIII